MGRMRPLPSIIRFNQFLSGVVKLGEYSAAACLFRDFCNLGIPINEHTMTIAIDTYCLSNRVGFGFSILGSFFKRRCVPDAFTFCTLLKGLFRESRSDDARELFTKITQDRSCELNVVVYGTVIDGLCTSGGVAAAMELLGVMEKGSCKPDTQIYNMVIDALCKDKLVDSALKLFDEMSEKGRVVDGAEQVLRIMKQQNVVPDLVTYNALMHGYCLQGRLDEARKVFDSMSGKSIAPNVRSFSILINGYCKNKKIEEARHLLLVMKRKGLNPNVVTYTSMLHGLFREGSCSEARKLYDEMQAAGIKPDFHTYSILLDGLFENGHFEEALSLLDDLEQKGDVCIFYYNVVMNAFCKDKKLHRLRAVFSGLGSKGLEPDVVTYTILIKACCQDGVLDEAKDVFSQMKEANVVPNGITYNCMVQACLKRGEDEDAASFVEEMVDKGFSPDAATLELVLSLPGTVENNPTLFRIAQKLAPKTFGNKSMSQNV